MVDRSRRDEQTLRNLCVPDARTRRRSTSSSRAVKPAVLRRVDGRGPLGTSRAPRSRSRRATIVAPGRAPSPCSSARARRMPSSTSHCASATACSYGQPCSAHWAAAESQSSVSPSAYGPDAWLGGAGTGRPARQRQYKRRQTASSAPRSTASARTSAVARSTSFGLPWSQATSAPAAARSTIASTSSAGTPTVLLPLRPRLPPGLPAGRGRGPTRAGPRGAARESRADPGGAARELHRLGPAALVEHRPRGQCEHIDPPQIEVVFHAVLKRGGQIGVREVVMVSCRAEPTDVVERARHLLTAGLWPARCRRLPSSQECSARTPRSRRNSTLPPG